MAQLRQDYQSFQELSTEIVFIGPESAGSFRKYWIKNDLQFIGLPDPEHKILKLFKHGTVLRSI